MHASQAFCTVSVADVVLAGMCNLAIMIDVTLCFQSTVCFGGYTFGHMSGSHSLHAAAFTCEQVG